MPVAAVGLKTYIWNNNIKSVILLACFPILVYLMLWLFFVVLQYLSLTNHNQTPEQLIQILNNAGVEGIRQYWLHTLLVVGMWFAIAFFTNQSFINMATGAEPVTREQEQRLYNLLENLCISRGLVTPKIYVIDSPVLNAYASGINKSNYAVTLTRGLLQSLDDKELEAVLAHELTHILNKDVRLLIICIVFVGIFSYMAQMAFRSLRYSNIRFSNDRGRKGQSLYFLIAGIILTIGYLLALVLRFSLSRKREYLADAGSVELTKNPEALISALQKISGHSTIENVPAEVSQMFIDNPPEFFGMFSTHPSIEDRIAEIKMIGGVKDDVKAPAKPEIPTAPTKKGGPWDNKGW